MLFRSTTRYSIAAGLHALCHQPELLGQMQAGGTVWDTAPDEIIRWGSATTYFRRTATRDFDLHGKQVKAGQKVIYWWASGNRDERVLDDPMRVNLMRSPNRHLSFGQGGPHVCLGMWLARLEVRVLFQELLKQLACNAHFTVFKCLQPLHVEGVRSGRYFFRTRCFS